MENKKCENCAQTRLREETVELLQKHEKRNDSLIKILEEVQVKYGYIPRVSQIEISKYLDMPLAEIYGVITFYSRFSLKPKGKYNVSICLVTACFVKGANEILESAKEKLGIGEGETTQDGKFSLDTTRCVGACGLAPVFTINDEVYGNSTVKKFNEVMDEYIKNN